MPHLAASNLSYARHPRHVRDVSNHLREHGILKVSLAFPDDTSRYLQDLVHSLHRNHGHILPIAHSAARGWFWDVRPNDTIFQSHNHQARSETMQDFPWHTDCSYEECPPGFFALQVLQHDRQGGGTLSVMRVDRLLRHLSPSTTATLLKPQFRIDVPAEFIKNEHQQHIIGNILAVDETGLPSMLRFREEILTPLTTNASGALNELKQYLTGTEAMTETLHLTPECMPRGSILLMDNRRWLHARNEVRDPMRHLRRIRWNAVPFPRSL